MSTLSLFGVKRVSMEAKDYPKPEDVNCKPFSCLHVDVEDEDKNVFSIRLFGGLNQLNLDVWVVTNVVEGEVTTTRVAFSLEDAERKALQLFEEQITDEDGLPEWYTEEEYISILRRCAAINDLTGAIQVFISELE